MEQNFTGDTSDNLFVLTALEKINCCFAILCLVEWLFSQRLVAVLRWP